jgi:hypothetical protein
MGQLVPLRNGSSNKLIWGVHTDGLLKNYHGGAVHVESSGPIA